MANNYAHSSLNGVNTLKQLDFFLFSLVFCLKQNHNREVSDISKRLETVRTAANHMETKPSFRGSSCDKPENLQNKWSKQWLEYNKTDNAKHIIH